MRNLLLAVLLAACNGGPGATPDMLNPPDMVGPVQQPDMVHLAQAGDPCALADDCPGLYSCMAGYGQPYCSWYCSWSVPPDLQGRGCPAGFQCQNVGRNQFAPVTDGGMWGRNTDAGQAYTWVCVKP